jgi:hypothetical protein
MLILQSHTIVIHDAFAVARTRDGFSGHYPVFRVIDSAFRSRPVESWSIRPHTVITATRPARMVCAFEAYTGSVYGRMD